jgi:hypothetical protein
VNAKRDNKNNPLTKITMKTVTMKTYKAYKKGDKKAATKAKAKE